MENVKSKQVSRRSFLKGAALLASISVVPAVVVSKEAAAAKMAKAALQYQDQPKGQLECANCVQYVAGKSSKANGTCNVVDGSISPRGWCLAYAAKG